MGVSVIGSAGLAGYPPLPGEPLRPAFRAERSHIYESPPHAERVLLAEYTPLPRESLRLCLPFRPLQLRNRLRNPECRLGPTLCSMKKSRVVYKLRRVAGTFEPMSEPSQTFRSHLTKAPRRIFEIANGWIFTLNFTTTTMAVHDGRARALAIEISTAPIRGSRG